MKQILPILLLCLTSLGVAGQPMEFNVPLDPSCADFPNFQRFRSIISEVGGPGSGIVVDETDYVAAFDTDNFVVGLAPIMVGDAFGCTNAATFNLVIFQQDQPGGPSNSCQAPPYGALNGEPVRVIFWDALTGNFYEFDDGLTYNVNTTVGFESGDDCTTEGEFFTTQVDPPTNTLPVAFTSFTGRAMDKVVALDWATAFESGNDYYSVERSTGDQPFEVIGRVTGAGDSQEETTYGFIDEAPGRGLNFYRIRQTDFTGISTTTHIIEVLVGSGTGIEAAVYPNPADNVVSIRTAGVDRDDRMFGTLYDQNGRQLWSWSYTGDRYTLDVSRFAAGLYQVRLEDARGESTVHRLVVR